MFESQTLGRETDVIAPDGSEIRFLPVLKGGSMVHCRLPQGAVTQAVTHKTVEELWYVIAGRGQLWRKMDGHEAVADLLPGTSHTIPLGCHFQFRASRDQALEFVIVTMPPWPNMEEAEPVENYWPQHGADAS